MSDNLLLPVAIEAEQAVLGCVLMNNGLYADMARIVSERDFSETVHQNIWEATCVLIEEGRPATPLSLMRVLPNEDIGDGMTMRAYLARLAANAVSPINAREYAEIVREAAKRRQLCAVGDYLNVEARVPGSRQHIIQIATGAIMEMDEIIRTSVTRQYRYHVADAGQKAIDAIEKVRSSGVSPGVKTGIAPLDDLTGGLFPSEMIVVAGRPGMGKTAIVITIMMNMARENYAGLFFSLEMDDEQISHRMLSAQDNLMREPREYKIPYLEIRRGKLRDDRMERLILAQREIARWPLFLDCEPSISISQIAVRARRFVQEKRRAGMSVGAVMIDYLGLVAGVGRAESREREVSNISGAIKALAKELEIPVIVLAQLNRQAEGRDNKRPQLSDLRDSGSIEQDADAVIGLFREEYYLSNRSDLSDKEADRLTRVQNHLEIILLKHRQAKPGTVDVYCDISTNTIRAHDSYHDEPENMDQVEIPL